MLSKKFLTIVIAISLLFGFFAPNSALGEQDVTVYFFYDKLCPFCRKAEKFLDEIQKQYPELKINRYSVVDPQNREILQELAKKAGAEKHLVWCQ